MAVSRALRFEILRRDNHACRYCGATAPGTKLTVDHVLPEALGGTSDPTNLVTACEPCNGGKSATPPDAPVVADVKADALRWSRAVQAATDIRRADAAVRDAYVAYFKALWDVYEYGPARDRKPVPLDSNWRSSVENFYAHQLDEDELARAVRLAMDNDRIPAARAFAYFCGICWRVIREIRETAGQIAAADLDDEMNWAGNY